MAGSIACCGFDCSGCNARIATLKDDNELRAKQAAEWSKRYNTPDLTAEMINCTGCREEGPLIGHCEKCRIRLCVRSNGYDTCAECVSLESCEIVGVMFNYVPEALENLKEIREKTSKTD